MSIEVNVSVETSTWATKKGLAQMLKGGVIMDVVTPDQARIAEDAGAVAVMALERVPADIRATGGVARMSDPALISAIMDAVTIPVMAKARIGHFVEAQVLEALGVDYIDESEVLTPADEANHIDKHAFKVPFVCGARDLGEALRRINEGAAMMRTKGEAGTGDIVEAVRHIRAVTAGIRALTAMRRDELFAAAKELGAPYQLVAEVAASGRLPVVNFVAGGIATPADAALAMQLGAEGVFVGSGIFKSEDPATTANAIVQATTHFDDPASSPRSRAAWARRCAASSWLPSPRRSGSRSAAGRPAADSAPAVDRAIGPQRPGRLRRACGHARVARRRARCAVRLPEQLAGLAGLVLPGGESTTMRKLIDRWGLRQPILDLAAQGRALLGTCAGMILLAREISDGDEPVLAAARHERQAQRLRPPARLRSRRTSRCRSWGPRRPRDLHPGAPIVERVGEDVDVLATPGRRTGRGRPAAERPWPRPSTPSWPASRASIAC